MSNDPVKLDILNAALTEFANFGLEGARIDAIVSRTNTSKRMIYYHFGSKEGLYTEVLEYAHRLVRQGSAPIPYDRLSPLDALAAGAGGAFDDFCRVPDFIKLMVQENMQGGKFFGRSSTIAEMNRTSLAAIDEIVQRGKQDGSIRGDVTSLDVYMNFIGLCHYNISSRSTWMSLFGLDLTMPEIQARRRAAICDSIVRYARA